MKILAKTIAAATAASEEKEKYNLCQVNKLNSAMWELNKYARKICKF